MYNKLFYSILDSSVWLEPATTRIVWITFLAAMDEDGFARFAALDNLAARARVTMREAKQAVRVLEAPDPKSSNPDHEGRRVERVPGGWIVLNAAQHREQYRREILLEQNRLRVARHRAKKFGNAGNALQELQLDIDTDHKIESVHVRWDKHTGFSGIGKKELAEWAEAYPACDIDRQLKAMHQWLLSNPTRAKKSNWRKFITNWLSSQQDKGGDQRNGTHKRNAAESGRGLGTRNEGRSAQYANVGKVL